MSSADSPPPTIKEAIIINEAAIKQIDKLCEKLKKKVIEANRGGNKVEAKKYLQDHKRQIKIKENIKNQINTLKQCRPNAQGADACPAPDSEEIRKVNRISKIIAGPVSDDADDEAMLQRFREEFPEAQPDASELELERFLSEDEGGGDSKDEDEDKMKKKCEFIRNEIKTWVGSSFDKFKNAETVLNTSFYEHEVVNNVWKKKNSTAESISDIEKTELENDDVFKNTNVALKEMLEHIKELNTNIKSLTEENNTYVEQIVEIFTHIKQFLSKIVGRHGPYTKFMLWYPILISLIQILSTRIGNAPNIKGYRISKKMEDSALKKWFELLIKKYNYGGGVPGGSEVKKYLEQNNAFPPYHPYSKLNLRDKKVSEQKVQNGSEKDKYRYQIEIQPQDATQFVDLDFYRKMALFLKQVINDCATLLTEDEKPKILEGIDTSLGNAWTQTEEEDTIIKRFLKFAGERKEKLKPFIGKFKSIKVNDSNELVVTNSEDKDVEYNENQVVVILKLYSIISEEVFKITKDYEDLADDQGKFRNITKEIVERLHSEGEAAAAAAAAAAATNESKKYTMPIELIKKKIQIFKLPPTADSTNRTKLWELFKKDRHPLSDDKIIIFYKKLEKIYKDYDKNLKNKIVNFNPHLKVSMKPMEAYPKISKFINPDSTPPPELEAIKQMVKDLKRSSDTFTNSLTTLIDDPKNLFENFSKPLLIIYTKFMYDELKGEDENIEQMPVLSTLPESEKNKKQKEYSLLYWAQSDINIFRYVMDGLFLLYKNGEIHKPDIFDIIVTIHILYNCEYGSEFRGALNNPLPSMLAYKRVRYYCDRLYPEIFDILDMSEMIEVANIPEILAEPSQDLKTHESLKKKIKQINSKAVTTIKQCETVSCPRPPEVLKEGWKRSVHEESMKLLKHHMGYFRLFKNYYWSVFHSETFGMTENYIPLMFMDYKITITGKKKESNQEKRIFQPGLSWFKHLLERGSNAYYWLYTSLLIALKEEFIDNCGEITCDAQSYYGSDIMTNILNTLTCEINANGQIDTKGKNYTNITQFIPRAIEIYEEMNKSGRMDAIEEEAESKLKERETYKKTPHGKRYYLEVPDFDDELIMKRHEIKRELVSLLINKNRDGMVGRSALEAKLNETVFNAGLNNIPIPIGKKSEEKQITERSIKHGFKKTDTGKTKTVGEITFCSFDESHLIHKWYIEDIKEAELKNIKRRTRRCRKKKKVSNKTRKKMVKQGKKKLEKLIKKKEEEEDKYEKIGEKEKHDKEYIKKIRNNKKRQKK